MSRPQCRHNSAPIFLSQGILRKTFKKSRIPLLFSLGHSTLRSQSGGLWDADAFKNALRFHFQCGCGSKKIRRGKGRSLRATFLELRRWIAFAENCFFRRIASGFLSGEVVLIPGDETNSCCQGLLFWRKDWLETGEKASGERRWRLGFF